MILFNDLVIHCNCPYLDLAGAPMLTGLELRKWGINLLVPDLLYRCIHVVCTCSSSTNHWMMLRLSVDFG